jgi:flagellar protein FliS
MNAKIDAYQKTSVHTASKEQILLMLYQAAIRNCRLAMNAIEKKQIRQKGEYIGKMQDIIVELNNCLDHKVGGKISQELASLYDYLLFTSSQANMKIDASLLQNCLNVLLTLYDGWTEAIKSLPKNPGKNNGRVSA